jgi:long-chain acyl-CoA synthetase
MKLNLTPNPLPWAFLDEFRATAPWNGTGKPTFAGEWPTMPEMFRISFYRFSERPCFTIYEPDRISLNYKESFAKVRAVARALRAKGIRKGDKVAVTGKNSPEWTVAYLGVLFANAVVVPVDYQIKNTESDLLLKTARARILFVDEEKYEYYKNENLGCLEEIYSLKKGIGTYIYDLDGPEFEGTEADIGRADEPVTEFDTAAILFTSGTTGEPKGVMLSHRNLTADCYLAQGTPLILYPTDKFYAILPIHHAYTMLAVFIESISVGAELVFGKRLVVQNMLRDLREAKITMLLGVPMLFNKLLAGILRGIREKGVVVYGIITFLMSVSGFIKKVFGINPGKKMFASVLSKASLSTIRICICGGGPLSPSIFRKFNQLGLNFVQGYGLTETSPIININPIERYKETSVGRVCPGVDMKILDADEHGIGEIIVKGPMVMQGYFERPDFTEEAFTKDGYLKTGDVGYLDSENYLYLTGRAKNMIVTEGGKNVYPEEIENEFQLFDEVEQVLVRGFIPDKRTKDEHIEALIYPTEEFVKKMGLMKGKVTERIKEIIAEVNTRLLPYQKIEKTTVLEEPLEMTTTKKIKRESAK